MPLQVPLRYKHISYEDFQNIQIGDWVRGYLRDECRKPCLEECSDILNEMKDRQLSEYFEVSAINYDLNEHRQGYEQPCVLVVIHLPNYAENGGIDDQYIGVFDDKNIPIKYHSCKFWSLSWDTIESVKKVSDFESIGAKLLTQFKLEK